MYMYNVQCTFSLAALQLDIVRTDTVHMYISNIYHTSVVYFLPDAKKCAHRSVREEVRGGNLRVAKENHTGDHNVHVGHAQHCWCRTFMKKMRSWEPWYFL